MIVVDVGCHPHGGEVSVAPLVDRFHPSLLYGFDPFPELVEGVWPIGMTLGVFSRQAAWLHCGTVAYSTDGSRSRIGTGLPVACFDFAAWFAALPPTGVILKLDCEGAEYVLLDRLITRGLDERLDLLLVEWHDKPGAETQILDRISCPVELWS